MRSVYGVRDDVTEKSLRWEALVLVYDTDSQGQRAHPGRQHVP
jgi:hypothetical protein